MNSETAAAAEIWHAHRVSYGETDAMGVMYYAEYLHLFERSRSELIRACGISYMEVEKRGFFLPVREASCRYRSPARYDDLIYIHARISEWGRASVTFSYTLYDEAKTKVLATGMTQHAFVDTTGKPTPVPAWLKELLTGNTT